MHISYKINYEHPQLSVTWPFWRKWFFFFFKFPRVFMMLHDWWKSFKHTLLLLRPCISWMLTEMFWLAGKCFFTQLWAFDEPVVSSVKNQHKWTMNTKEFNILLHLLLFIWFLAHVNCLQSLNFMEVSLRKKIQILVPVISPSASFCPTQSVRSGS